MKCVWVLEEILFSGSGTPGYYPPEKLAIKKDQDSLDLKNSQFKLTPKSDIYSLGVVFLEILTGKTVDDSHSVEKAFITLSNDQHFAPLHDMLSKMIHPEKAMRPKTNTILKILIQEKGWDLQLAKEGIKKAQTLLTDDFWKTHDTFVECERIDNSPIFDFTFVILKNSINLESEENKKRTCHPTTDRMTNKKTKNY